MPSPWLFLLRRGAGTIPVGEATACCVLLSQTTAQLVQLVLGLVPGGMVGGFRMGADIGWEQNLGQVFNPRKRSGIVALLTRA